MGQDSVWNTHTHKHLNDVRHHNAHNELEVLDVQESIELRKRVIRSPLESSFFRGVLFGAVCIPCIYSHAR